eukprot:290406-Chlamydomonas_euryale.AAC.1
MAALQQMGPLGMRAEGGAEGGAGTGAGGTSPGGSGQALVFLTRPSITNTEAAEEVGRLQWERPGAKPLGLLDGVSVRQ